MGIYLFSTEVLIEALEDLTHDDFGGDIIPASIQTHRVYGFEFDGYWVDIGTIRSFYETNLSLTRPNPPFKFNDPDRPIYSRARFLPGSVIDGATLHNVLLADGCQVGEANIEDSLIGLRSQIGNGVHISRSILMGADYYDPSGETPPGGIPLGIGSDCEIEGAIIDKNTRIGRGVIIRPFPRGTELDHDTWNVRDGIVVIPKGSTLTAGTVIAPE